MTYWERIAAGSACMFFGTALVGIGIDEAGGSTGHSLILGLVSAFTVGLFTTVAIIRWAEKAPR